VLPRNLWVASAVVALLAWAAAAGAPPERQVEITVQDGVRRISSDGIPDHATGKFPNAGNPNAISRQGYRFRVPEKPRAAERPVEVGHTIFGVALNGIVFDPSTAEWWKDDPSLG
jgi:hypothetical protein